MPMLSRTKFLLLVVVFLIIAIPVMYVCLTWTVEDPLRFRLLGYAGPTTSPEPSLGTPVQLMKFDLEVRNTSSVPMHVFVLYVESEDQPHIAPGFFEPYGVPTTHPGSGTEYLSAPIQPRSTARVTCYLPGDSPGVLTNVRPSIAYISMTHTQYRFMNWLTEVCDSITFLEDYLPEFDVQQDISPLEMPNPLPASTDGKS